MNQVKITPYKELPCLLAMSIDRLRIGICVVQLSFLRFLVPDWAETELVLAVLHQVLQQCNLNLNVEHLTAIQTRLRTTTDLRPPLLLLPNPTPSLLSFVYLIISVNNSQRSTFILCNQLCTLIRIFFKMAHFIATM